MTPRSQLIPGIRGQYVKPESRGRRVLATFKPTGHSQAQGVLIPTDNHTIYLTMSPGSINLSPLERFLSTSDPASAPDEPSLDLENICALRNRSMRKFVRALESIAARYEGDGDEESDDVIDLDQLQVIEDRGYILKRLSHNSQPSPSSLKGKNRADPRLEIFELLDPTSQDADDQDENQDEWAGQHDEDDDDHLNEDQSGSTDDEDYNSDDSDSSSINSIPSSSSTSSSSSSSSSQNIRRKEESNGKRKKLDLLPPSTSDSSTSQSAPDSLTDQSTPRISYLDSQDTVTNALFERLKKRVQERSSDITRHKLHKASISRNLYRPDDESCGFSSPSSSLITSTSLSSVLTTTEPMISPYLQRLLNPCGTGSSRPVQDNRPRALLSVPVTPSTLRQKSFQPTSETGGALHTSPQTCSVLRKRPRPSSPIFSSPRTISSSIRPALLFPSPPNTAHKAKKFKPHSPPQPPPITNHLRNHHQKRQQDPQEQDHNHADDQDEEEDDEKERRARESSEDPMLLPASSKRSKIKTKFIDSSSTSTT
ncbi:hypothetical protein PGTUg99_009627 [Puccinia graminis f. sp. tritici]|uniref:Uncharacterized protein n=2 Tax=Puccinia graminis f. sp. tritici TaxID=56615 RepID=A0A5B0NW04_PUCGR|nr:hypothetical protein PGTUg99_009627 [Puccinia graminis f. sp. tritici]